jgi:hypothetical protein
MCHPIPQVTVLLAKRGPMLETTHQLCNPREKQFLHSVQSCLLGYTAV